MTSRLLVKPSAMSTSGAVHRITPESAGWTYVGFEVLDLQPGEQAARETQGREACLIIMSGRASIMAGAESYGVLGERVSPFDGSPWSVYVPAKSSWSVQAQSACELAIGWAPAEGRLPPRVIPPSKVGQETRGTGSNTRYVRNILPETEPAESLLIAEVITPGGHWSSYPPHKHDVSSPSGETQLEETYYHRLRHPTGFAVQRVYTDDLSIDETIAVFDRDVVMVPKGYHPVGAPAGLDLYYLNVMAGPERRWRITVAPGFAFLK
jgi:5-deoxy-glucuronate isomerase